MNFSADQAGPATELWQFAREKAALSGAFEPLVLMMGDHARSELDEATLVEALTKLGEECEEVRSDSGPRWRLNPDSRRSVLRKLFEEKRLTHVALDVHGRDNDLFGRCLVDSVLGRNVLVGMPGREQLDELHTAVQFIADFNPDCPRPVDVERAFARKESDAAITLLLPHKFIGREDALRKLRAFAGTPPVDAEPALALVTGPGGAGKSALLGEFVRRRRMMDANASVVWIDFDRAGMVSADPVKMMVEFAFQLSLANEALAHCLITFRDKFRQLADQDKNFEARASSESAMWSEWNALMGQFLPLQGPVVLILDTFEEVLCRDQLVSMSLLRWIDNLVAEGRVFGLKPILGGRAIPNEAIAPMLDRIDLRLPLGDIAPKSARRLLGMHLERHGCNPDEFPLEALVEKLGGNPLLLKILAQDLRDHGVSEANKILAEIGSSEFQAQFAQTFLYRRILGRLHADDPDVVKVAHPGLVLRRVTPSLIQQVLAHPCGLGEITNARAKELFAKLSLQVWLLERVGEDAVRHRRDLRRLMLQVMSSEHPEISAEIHRAAVTYYRHYRDATIGTREQDTERRYHSMFTSEPDMPRDREADAFVSAIGEDIFDINLGLRAELKVQGSRSLSGDEAAAVREEFQSRVESRARSSRQAQGSLEEEIDDTGVKDFIPSDQIERTIGGLFNASRFGVIARNAESMSRRFFEDHLEGRLWSHDLKGTMIDHPIWSIAMSVLPTPGRRRFIKQFAVDALANARLMDWHQPLMRRPDSVSMALITACILVLHGEEVPDFLDATMLGRESGKRREDHETLRQLGLLSRQQRVFRPSRTQVPLQLLRFMSPQFRESIANVRAGEISVPSELRANPAVLLHNDLAEMRPAMLGSIESMGSGWSDLIDVLHWPPRSANAKCVLRTTLVELHAPARGCLQRAGSEAVLEYAERMERADPRWPLELHAEQLQNGLRRDADRWHATFVRMCDRFGRFDDLLDFMHRRAPKSRAGALLALAQAYDRRLEAALSLLP